MKKKIVFVTSDMYYVKAFLSRQIRQASLEYDVALVVNADPAAAGAAIGNVGKVFNFSIHRKISLLRDAISLFRMVMFLLRVRPDIVHSTTPKAGLLAMIAARITGVEFRLHTFTGQVWQTRTGLMRKVLIWTDKVTAACASNILTDSLGQLDILAEAGIVDSRKAAVLGHGSICGVNATRYAPNAQVKADMRKELGLPNDAIVMLYMARFTEDKGALAMADAYAAYGNGDGTPTHLLMVGPDEEQLTDQIRLRLADMEGRYSLINYTDVPERFFQCCDLFCLPSYREGFPMVLLNAAACEVPVIASRIYGCTDAVVDGKTGLLFEAGNIAEFCAHLRQLAGSASLRQRLGKHARSRVEQHYTEEHVNRLLMHVYKTRSVSSSPVHAKPENVSDTAQVV